jgi:hypothetical protein
MRLVVTYGWKNIRPIRFRAAAPAHDGHLDLLLAQRGPDP